jgi:hypothetical protein
MSAPNIADSDTVEIQLRKWAAREHFHKVTLRPKNSHASIPAGEAIVAEVVDRGGQGVFSPICQR